MNESIIQPEAFPNDFCMFAIILVYIELNTFSMSLLLIIISTFEIQYKFLNFVLS